jgi:hypothetical protein
MILALSGCGSTSPTVREAASPTLQPTSIASPSPSSPATEAPIASPTPITDLELDLQTIDQQYTTPLLEVTNDGTSIIWSSGANVAPDAEHAPDLFYFTPGSDPPRVIYSSDNREANLIPIKAGAGRFAFAESFLAPDGLSLTWKAWFMDGPDDQPVLIDEADGIGAGAGPLPFFEVDADRLVWTAFHGPAEEQRSEVLVRDHDSGQTRVLFSAPIDDRQYWFVDLEGSLLVYGTIEYSADGASERRHVYLMDLAAEDAVPERLDNSGLAAMPQIRGDAVVWKESDLEFHLLNVGKLVRYSMADGTAKTIDIGQRGANYPSIGNRFLAAWGEDATRFDLYDMATDRLIEGLHFDPAGAEAIVRPTIVGDLLTLSHVPAEDDELELQWARLDQTPPTTRLEGASSRAPLRRRRLWAPSQGLRALTMPRMTGPSRTRGVGPSWRSACWA